jgi:hypothetical protein
VLQGVDLVLQFLLDLLEWVFRHGLRSFAQM